MKSAKSCSPEKVLWKTSFLFTTKLFLAVRCTVTYINIFVATFNFILLFFILFKLDKCNDNLFFLSLSASTSQCDHLYFSLCYW